MSVQCHCGSWDHEPWRHPTTDTRPLTNAGQRLADDYPARYGGALWTDPVSRQLTIEAIREVEQQAADAERARHAALVAAVIRLHDSLSPDETRGVLWRNVEDALYPRGTSDG